jgi:hypothetical protein
VIAETLRPEWPSGRYSIGFSGNAAVFLRQRGSYSGRAVACPAAASAGPAATSGRFPDVECSPFTATSYII